MKVKVCYTDKETLTFESGAFVDFGNRCIHVHTERDTDLFIPFENLACFEVDYKTPKKEE